MMDRYRMYNETKDQWEFVISDVEPTVLPDNPADTVRAGSVSITHQNVLVNDGTAKQLTLPNYKLLRFDEIDKRTGEKITEGFEFPPASGNVFSFSANAQSNLLGTYSAKDLLTYPFGWSTKDDHLVYQIADVAEMSNFFLTALGTKKAWQDSGTALKQAVEAATDEAEVDAIIDNR
jgi:hypothetical protein